MLTVIAGAPCAGKSTYAKANFPKAFEFDDWVQARFNAPLRPAMAAYRQAYPASRQAYLTDACTAALHGCPALVDCFVRRNDRLEVLNWFRKAGIGPLKLIYLEVPLDELLRRGKTRVPPHRPETLHHFFRIQQPPRMDEGWDSILILAPAAAQGA